MLQMPAQAFIIWSVDLMALSHPQIHQSHCFLSQFGAIDKCWLRLL
jgi:hypothetical protein